MGDDAARLVTSESVLACIVWVVVFNCSAVMEGGCCEKGECRLGGYDIRI